MQRAPIAAADGGGAATATGSFSLSAAAARPVVMSCTAHPPLLATRAAAAAGRSHKRATWYKHRRSSTWRSGAPMSPDSKLASTDDRRQPDAALGRPAELALAPSRVADADTGRPPAVYRRTGRYTSPDGEVHLADRTVDSGPRRKGDAHGELSSDTAQSEMNAPVWPSAACDRFSRSLAVFGASDAACGAAVGG